jgi:hypothetical protein
VPIRDWEVVCAIVVVAIELVVFCIVVDDGVVEFVWLAGTYPGGQIVVVVYEVVEIDVVELVEKISIVDVVVDVVVVVDVDVVVLVEVVDVDVVVDVVDIDVVVGCSVVDVVVVVDVDVDVDVDVGGGSVDGGGAMIRGFTAAHNEKPGSPGA